MLSILDLARARQYRNINLLCIDYALRPRLSSRLTLGGLAFPRNPWAFGGGVSHPSLATHACILTRWRSTSGYPAASQHHRCPAMRACALALTGSSLVEPVIDAANAFADALQEADQFLSPEAVAALAAPFDGARRDCRTLRN